MSRSNNISNSTHDGHRERLRKRFLTTGGEDFADHELLELLLFYPIPRMNTNGIAHGLINEFGSLKNVMYADPKRLEHVEGVGQSTSFMFSLIKVINKRISLEKYDMSRFVADSLSKVGNFLVDYYKDKEEEELCALFLDSSFRVLGFKSLSKGNANCSGVDVKLAIQNVIELNATQVIIAHNHPRGMTAPSSYDRHVTMKFDTALNIINVNLIDHVIVSGMTYTPTLHTRVFDQNSSKETRSYRYFFDN